MALYRHEFVICPWCDEQSGRRVDHLYDDRMPRTFGPWYCEECRRGFSGTVRAPSDVEVTRENDGAPSFSRSMALLRFDGKSGPVFFVMDHNRYHSAPGESDEENQSHQRYFFEEHSCPTNWLRECVCVIQNDDTDPHGFLSFVRASDVPEDFDEYQADWSILFPEAFGAPIIDGDAIRISGTLEHRK